MTTTPQNLAQEFARFRLEQASEALSGHRARGALDEWPLHTGCSCGWRPRGVHSSAHHQAAVVMAAMGLATFV